MPSPHFSPGAWCVTLSVRQGRKGAQRDHHHISNIARRHGGVCTADGPGTDAAVSASRSAGRASNFNPTDPAWGRATSCRWTKGTRPEVLAHRYPAWDTTPQPPR